MSAVTIPTTGDEATGYLALPPGGLGAGVLVLHAWWGLTPIFRAACDRLAAAGFVALAPDLYGGETAATIDEAQALVARRDTAARQARANGALAYLQGLPEVHGAQVGVVGFSMGGSWACFLAGEHPTAIAAVATFYDDSELEPGTRAAVLGHFGEADEFADVAALTTLVEQWRTIVPAASAHFYPGAHHWFAEEDRPGYYDAEATEIAWARTIDFLVSNLASNLTAHLESNPAP